LSVRSAVYYQTKAALQSAKGTAATLGSIVNGGGWTRPKPIQRGGTMHTNQGEPFPSTVVPSTKGHTESEFGGKLTFNNLVLPFATMFGNVSTSANGTNGKLRNFQLGNGISITRTYLTLEFGDSSRAKKIIDWFGKALTISLSDESTDIKMPGMGGVRQDDTTPTSSPTSVTPSIINPSAFDVFLATSAAGLDTAEGTAQVETATVVGTIGSSGAGNATVVFTSAAVTGSPITLQVAVANNDTAAQVAAKIITALQADAYISAAFAIGGSSASIVATALVNAANDSSLNISIDNGTCSGLTTAATSANTTAGVAPNKFALPYMTELSIPDIVGLVYRMNSADTSYHDTVALAGIPSLKVETGDDDNEYGTLLPYIASGASLFWRMVAKGAVIAGAVTSRERFAIDIATKLPQAEEPGENQGAASNAFSLMGVHDPTWGKMLNIQLINSVAAITGTP